MYLWSTEEWDHHPEERREKLLFEIVLKKEKKELNLLPYFLSF